MLSDNTARTLSHLSPAWRRVFPLPALFVFTLSCVAALAAPAPGPGELSLRLVELNRQLQQARPAAREALLPQMRQAAWQRRQQLSDLLEQDPAAVLRLALPGHYLGAMPEELGNLLEQRQQLEGELEVVYEDLDDGGARLRHYLRTADGRLALAFAQPPRHLVSGDRVRASGLLLDNSLVLASQDNLLTLATDGGADGGDNGGLPAPLSDTLGARRTAVVLVNFRSQPEQPWTVEQARDAMFVQASAFFQENSFGQTWLEGDVFGWFTLDVDPTGCPTTDIRRAAESAAVANGVDPSSYDHMVYAFPHISCSYGGQATVGGSPSWALLDGTLDDQGTVTHELGHNLGLRHSHSMDCHADVVGSDCLVYEYGDLLDRMGADNTGHYNAFQKARLGWLGAGVSPPLLTVQSSGTYHIEPYASQTPGAKALRVSRDTDPVSGAARWLYIEQRAALGYDAFLETSRNGPTALNGLIFHLGTDGEPNSSYLLDMNPDSQKYDWDDMALALGVPFTDPASGTTVTLEQLDDSGATISVDTGSATCAHRAPALAVSPSTSAWVGAGTPVAYTLSVTNTDSGACAASSFDLSALLPVGWDGVFDASSLQLSPGGTGVATVTVTSPGTAPAGSFDISLVAGHGAAPLTAEALVTYVVDGSSATVDSEAPTVPRGLAASASRKQVDLSWSASDDNVGVAGYRVWRDGTLLGETSGTGYSDRNLADGVQYEYRVDAYDAANNTSGLSAAVVAGKSGGKGSGGGGGGGKGRGGK